MGLEKSSEQASPSWYAELNLSIGEVGSIEGGQCARRELTLSGNRLPRPFAIELGV